MNSSSRRQRCKLDVSATSSEPPWLLQLIDELLVDHIGREILAEDVAMALKLREVCGELNLRLAPVLRASELAKNLRWDRALSRGHHISEARRILVRTHAEANQDRCAMHKSMAWAAGGLLPSSGVFSWLVQIDRTANNFGRVLLGVSDEPSTTAWGLCPFDGRLYRRSRDPRDFILLDRAPPPDDFPDGDNTTVLYGDGGKRFNLDGRAEGKVIEFRVDASAGTLDFRVKNDALHDGERWLRGLSGFPPGVRLRPWARLIAINDCIKVNARADLLMPKLG